MKMKSALAWLIALLVIVVGLGLVGLATWLTVIGSLWEWTARLGLVLYVCIMVLWGRCVGRAESRQVEGAKKDNSRDAVCSVCAREADVLRCPVCGALCCTHYSLWADDDPRRLMGEQLVHRCNECKVELECIVEAQEANS